MGQHAGFPNPAGGAASLAHASAYLTSTLGLGNGVKTEVVSLDLAAGTWLIMASALNASEAFSCDIDIWLDSASGAISTPYGGSALTQNVTGTTAFSPATSTAFQAIITLPAAQTVYFNAEAIGQTAQLNSTNINGVSGATGMVAIKIA